jgi:hypothetical protein
VDVCRLLVDRAYRVLNEVVKLTPNQRLSGGYMDVRFPHYSAVSSSFRAPLARLILMLVDPYSQVCYE